ncbi:zinc ABC transporter substrate-binding protein ZnuA [Pararhizobium antarcticum]|uniref:High-affinity zinc uptake system protein ZnuA n=1 Tax=Pararhizobium antarcticum TaxID=1798805 RepID=A0A657LKX7_9HYPH|nr:zinc ABC transporter substrate-binding protein ZnuA [Pararhizobium antarcticum]OJF90721.1 zinc transporter [Pararhizobium antarcticum]OJF93568.1 zinc transporter [Rhizobium sp. 58]
MLTKKALLLASVLALSAGATQAKGPDVVVSIKPIHSLVASIMQGVGEPALIVEGSASPHTYSMKPSNAAALQDAAVVFWLGHGLEAFLEKPLESLGTGARIVELEDAPGLEKLKFREGGAFEAHDDGDEHESGGADSHDTAHDAAHEHHHDEGEVDMHLWLDPHNAKAMAAEIEKTLAEIDPANAATYKTNLANLDARLDALDKTLVETVAPIKDKPFIAFHDAYQYFEKRYGVTVAGSITVSPESMPGAERISQIHKKIGELGATCVFAEPQFEPKLVTVVLEGTPAKSGTLDPEGATIEPGPDLYFKLMENMGASLKACLSSKA